MDENIKEESPDFHPLVWSIDEHTVGRDWSIACNLTSLHCIVHKEPDLEQQL